jgi:hypothetical protein
MEAYLIRRVRELLGAGWEYSRIFQQLQALDSKKKIKQLIEQVSR